MQQATSYRERHASGVEARYIKFSVSIDLEPYLIAGPQPRGIRAIAPLEIFKNVFSC